MKRINHHVSEELLVAYAAGALPYPFALVVATHLSMCDECRVRLAAHETMAGLIVEETAAMDVDPDLKSRVLAMLDEPAPVAPPVQGAGIFPAFLFEALNFEPPRWKHLGFGSRQSILSDDNQGSVRLLYIPAGQAVPDHGHNGLELTLVLQGAFSDSTGRFGVGDLEIANDDLEHTPIAEEGEPCICLAATDASLRFNSLIPRLLQPILKI